MADNTYQITPELLALAQEQFDALITPAQVADHETIAAPKWAQTSSAMLQVLCQDKATLLAQFGDKANNLPALLQGIRQLSLHLQFQQRMADTAAYRLTVVASTLLTRH